MDGGEADLKAWPTLEHDPLMHWIADLSKGKVMIDRIHATVKL